MNWIVSPEESGEKLIYFLAKHLKDRYSARSLKKMIEENGCEINGKTQRFASTILGKGDSIQINLEKTSAPKNRPLEANRMLYQDEWFLIYDKPSGVNSDKQGIIKIIEMSSPGIQLIHRLDKETSGVLMMAKNELIMKSMIEQFKTYAVKKKYLAIADGRLKHEKGCIENYLGKKKEFAGQTIWGEVSKDKGSYACTEWERLTQGKDVSLIACYPKTGRTHQIRVHLSEMGHPILGDYQYGKQFKCNYKAPRLLLHAESLQFTHPVTQMELMIKAPLPDDFKKAEKILFT